MPTIFAVLSQLEQERNQISSQLASISSALAALKKSGGTPSATQSAAGRALIAAAQRARWAKVKGVKRASSAPNRRKMSASAIAKIRAAQKTRWAKWRKQQRAA